ncbi:hypothetical protein PTSG_02499 [Salpingoeca rosetta]|uniref:Iron-binding zinc finger CDGSH type domain-containing protein n=1 Tax=Salpingoeca rosetta (strain ATCC 50818 / BSB-021) TaxID=946362 RepID=F2U2D4_SALR5|nr:uncharacterized protein PTSG_02499 [Salpingoeca rosetta]EGD81786.1 hypothetical protein PTSG_02499 [Salpingoeca rosetta]|eukprot:XP_004996990.1 hypothetical protein PTSG_02499 [Salpingoeca rosetta]
MEVFQVYIKQQLPQYLASLPIPATLDGYLELTQEEWLQIAPLFSLIFSMILLISIQFFVGAPSSSALNTAGHEAKEVRKLQKKTAFCRCWQSKKFPLCDGSHHEHNKRTGDNLGPIVVE